MWRNWVRVFYTQKEIDDYVPTKLLRGSKFLTIFETEGTWKKLYAKFVFQVGPAYGTVETSYREKEDTRCFPSWISWVTVERSSPEKKKKKNFEFKYQGYFVHKLFLITFIMLRFNDEYFFIYSNASPVTLICIVSYYVYLLFLCSKKVECITQPAKRNICNVSGMTILSNLFIRK